MAFFQNHKKVTVFFFVLALALSAFYVLEHINLFNVSEVTAQTGNFVGIQLSESGIDESGVPGVYGDPQFAPFSNFSITEWAVDNNAFDPNFARVWISSFVSPDTDFRIGVQTIDSVAGQGGCDSQSTPASYTPWASDGGGSSGWQSDINLYDPNCARLFIQTRPMPPGKGVTDARFGVAVGDRSTCSRPGQPSGWTPWAKSGGGWSNFVRYSGTGDGDFDCILVGLETKIVQSGSVTVRTQADGSNPPPPATWVLLNGANNIVAQESDGSVSETYTGLPVGSYKLDRDYIPATITHQGRTYVLDITRCPSGGQGGICSSDTQQLGTPDGSCSVGGTYNPHVTCVQNSCQVVAGCGYSDCSACTNPQGGPGRPPRQVKSFWGIPIAYAVDVGDDGTNVHNVCQAGYCTGIPGPGADECQQSSSCPGYVPPPPPAGPPPPPPPPGITFTIHYKVQAGGSLSANLVPTPSSGPSPLNVSLSATVAGGTGSVTYHFWKDCTEQGASIQGTNNACGQANVVTVPDGQTPGTVSYTYTNSSTNGTEAVFTPKVIAVRTVNGSLAQTNKFATVRVTASGDMPPPGSELSCSSTPSTTACLGEQVEFRAANGGGSYTWTSINGTGSGPVYRTNFHNVGQQSATVTSAGYSRTCNVTVTDCSANGPSLACIGPATAPRLTDITFRATSTLLTGNHAWMGGGEPSGAGVTGPTFTTNYFFSGTKRVRVTRAGFADVCTVQVTDDAPPGSSCTINVTSNAATNWTISGPTPDLIHSPTYPNLVFSGIHTTDDDGASLPFGTYQIVPLSNANGWRSPVVTPASSGNCSAANPTLNFNIDYRVTPPTDAPICSPPTQDLFLAAGGNANFSAFGGTNNYSWSAPGGFPAFGNGSSFSTTYQQAGTKLVTLSDGVSSSTCSVQVFGIPPPRCFGPSTLFVNQDGTFTATGGGTSDYLWTTGSQGSGTSIPLTGRGTTFTTRFTAPGSGKIVRATAGSTSGVCRVNVSSGSGSHSVCQNQACVSVSGPGVNRCSSNADCGGGTNNPPFHGACDPVQRACVNRAGSGPSCSSDPNCSGTTTSHLECQNNSCVIVNGPGANTCSVIGGSCTTNGPASCTFNAVPEVISRGESSQLEWSCTGPISSCTITDDLSNTVVTTGGAGGTISVSPLRTTPYSISCNNGAFTDSVTVRVLSIIEIPPL